MLNFTSYSFLKNTKTETTLKSFLTEEDKNTVSIFGYPDDDGVLKNGGKVGAALGPNSIRTALYKMTPTKVMKNLSLKDCGNLSFENTDLKERHEFASSKVQDELIKNKTCICFGGGHDYGYVDGAAFLNEQVKNNKGKTKESKCPLIFNFDAHFDLRNLDKGVSSGTPFFRLVEEFGTSFKLFEIGIQKQCNSENLFNYADSKENIHTLHYDNLYPDHEFDYTYFKNTVDSSTKEKQICYISVDIDGFSSAFAPGCSQSWPTGFDINSFFKMFNYLNSRFEVKILGIYEVSPPLDVTELTSRLAALIAYRFLELQS